MKRRRTNKRADADTRDLAPLLEAVDASQVELRRAEEQLERMTGELLSATRELHDLRAELRRHADRAESLLHSLNAVLSSVPLPLLVIDDKLRVSVLTPRAARLLGTDGSELEGRPIEEIGIRDSVDALGRAVLACSNGNGHSRRLTLAVNTPQGRRVRCRATLSPVPLENERRVMVVLEELARARR